MQLLTDILYKNIARNPQKRALAIKPRYRTLTWSYQDLFQFAQGIAKFLEERGTQKGDRAILWASNSPYWLGAFFGCLLRGVIVVPLHTENTPEFIQKVIAQTEPKVFFKSSDFSSDKSYGFIDIEMLDLEESYSPADQKEIAEDDIAEILYTSGTTGDPKGVMLTHKNIVSNLNSIWDLIEINENDRILSILPLSHIFEQIVEFRVLAAGAFIVYTPALSSSIIRKILKEYKIPKMVVVPEFLKRIMSRLEFEAEKRGKSWVLALLFALARIIRARPMRRLIFWSIHKQFGGKLGLIVSGGAPLEAPVAKKWQMLGVRIIQGYGLTETSPVLTALKPSDPYVESVGRIVPGVEIKIASDDEILAKGPNVTQGYWRNSEKTNEAFTPDGWLKTGDLGYFDKQDYLYIRGRKKFMILTGSGQNVYPEDIEYELNKESEIKDSAVLGIEKDGSTLIHAELLGNAAGENIKNAEEIITRVNKRLARYQQIQSWSVWPLEDFPRTITRKVKRLEVLDYLKKKEHPKVLRKTQGEASPIVRILSSVLSKPASLFTKDTRIVSLGFDSLARIELVARIEEEFGLEIDETQITHTTTVHDLEKLLAEKPRVKIKYTLRNWPRRLLAIYIREILFWLIVRPLFGIFMSVKVEGLENIKVVGSPVILMANHISDLDGVAVNFALPSRLRRHLAVAAATDVLFEDFWYVQPMAALLFNTYPFPRVGQTRLGFKYTGELLDRGWNILIFPEGRIPSGPGYKLQLKEGAGVAAVEMRVPIVPVKIEGSDRIMPRGKHFPQRRVKITVRFGKPLYFRPQISYQEATQMIRAEMERL